MAARVAKRASLELQHNLRKIPPRFYEALLTNPPAPSLVRVPQARPDSDLPTKRERTRKKKSLQPQPIVWEQEDRVRFQFYKDHPWERARAKTVTELDVVGGALKGKAKGLEWTELKQRSRNPTPDDAVAYIMNLHQEHAFSLKHAYQSGIAQFRALRASHEQATKFALLEAKHYGAQFSTFGYIGAGIAAENKALKKWTQHQEAQTANSASIAAAALLEPSWNKAEGFSMGQNYLQEQDAPKEEAEREEAAAKEAQRAAAVADVYQVLSIPQQK